jgi:hypothetical protein
MVLTFPQVVYVAWHFQQMVVGIILSLLLLNVLELSCYAILFSHIFHHNNNIAILILNPDVIKVRNTKNTISLIGQLATWILEASYALLGLYFASLGLNITGRELASFIKLSEFTLIPLVQIMCSPPLKNFVFKDK